MKDALETTVKNEKNSKKKKSFRREYLNDFKLNQDGNYVYVGTMYTYCAEGKSLKRSLVQLWVISLIVAVLQVVAGCIPAGGMMNTFYVILPYAIAMVTAAYMIWVLIRISMGGSDIKEYVYKATVERIPVIEILITVFSFMALAGDIVFIAMNGMGEKPIFTVLFLLCEAGSAALALYGRSHVKRLKWETKKR